MMELWRLFLPQGRSADRTRPQRGGVSLLQVGGAQVKLDQHTRSQEHLGIPE